jgi:hypothetical protein
LTLALGLHFYFDEDSQAHPGLGKLEKPQRGPYRQVIETTEGTTLIPIDREMITPRDLAKAEELSLVYPLGAGS